MGTIVIATPSPVFSEVPSHPFSFLSVLSSWRPPCPSYPPGEIVTGDKPPRERAGERDDPAYGNSHQLHQQGAGRAGEVSRVLLRSSLSLFLVFVLAPQ